MNYFINNCQSSINQEYDFDSVNIISELFLKLKLPLFNKVFLESLFENSNLQSIQGLYKELLESNSIEAQKVNGNIKPNKKLLKKLLRLESKAKDIAVFDTLPFEIIFKYIK
jgi:hypothetical protein